MSTVFLRTCLAVVGCAALLWTNVLCQVNIALQRPASQSCTYTGYGFAAPAAWAVDGNNNTNFYQKACAHTCLGLHPWWEVDLGQNYNVKSVAITRTGDNPYLVPRLSNMTIEVWMEDGATGDHINPRPCYSEYYDALPLGKRTSFPCRQGMVGRYLRIQLIGQTWLTLCEVEVFGIPLSNYYNTGALGPPGTSGQETVSGEINRALKRPANQSCELPGTPATAELAVDGNNNSNAFEKSCAHTCREKHPWWEVDLGQVYNVESVAITTMRNNPFVGIWLSYFRIELFVERDSKYARPCYVLPNKGLPRGERKSFTCYPGAVGRNVRIQGSGIDYLALCEVEVFGMPLTE